MSYARSVRLENPIILNRRLTEYYGRSHNKPNFRISWSRDQYEYRNTTRAKTIGKIIVGFTKGVQHLPKYEFLPPCWILEKLEFNCPPELVNAENGSYEPLWPFLDKDDQPQEPSWEMIAHAVDFLVYGKGPKVDIEKWA